MNWTEMLEQQAKAAYHAARGVIGVVDENELDWRPETGHNWLNTGQLIRHVSNSCGNTARGFVTGKWTEGDHGIDPEWKPAEGQPPLAPAEAFLSFTKAEALVALDADEKLFGEMLAAAGEERIDSERSVAPWGGDERPLGLHLLSCIQHLEQHKAQLFYYLKLQGKPVHTGTLWGM